MLVKNIVIEADEKDKKFKIKISDAKMDNTEKENNASKIIDKILSQLVEEDFFKNYVLKGE